MVSIEVAAPFRLFDTSVLLIVIVVLVVMANRLETLRVVTKGIRKSPFSFEQLYDDISWVAAE